MKQTTWKYLLLTVFALLGFTTVSLAQPTANYTANPTYGCTFPHTVFFTDLSVLPDTWDWDFGDGNTSTLQNPVHTYTALGNFTVELIVTDTVLGTADTIYGTVVVGDTAAPTITCPANQNVFFDSQCRFTLLDYTTMAVTSDDCGTVTVTQSPGVGIQISATQTVTLTADDGSGNTSTCTFDVIPADTTSPTITCPGAQTEFFDANCEYTLQDYTGMAGLNDNCASSFTVTQLPAIGTTITATTTTVTLTADDGSGNQSSCTFDITATDTISPSITCPANQNVPFDASCQYTLLDYTSMPTTSDNCGTVTVTQLPATGTVITTTQTITLTADDGNGNTSNCTFDVIPADSTAPSITCPGDDTIYVDASCVGTTQEYAALVTVTDNCDAAPTISQDPVVGTTVGSGSTTVTMYATDATGNVDSCSFTVVVLDTISPDITCGSNINSCKEVVTYTTPTATDNCGSVTVTQIAGLASGSTFPLGTTTCTFEATDSSGNTRTCSFDVTVFEEPTATAAATDVTCFGDGDGSIDATITGGTTPYTYDWSSSQTTEDIANLSGGTYTLIVTDSAGCADTVVVTVNEPAAISITTGSTTNASCNGDCDGEVDANVSGGSSPYTYAWSNSATSEDITGLCAGSYSLTVTDSSGCTATDNFSITEPDTISITYTASEYSHGHNISVGGNSDGSIDVTVSGGTSPYAYSWDHGSSVSDQEDLPAGTYTLTVTDNNGCTQTITIILTEPMPIVTYTAFSPNGDGLNDFFVIENVSDYPDNKLAVMNRWGDVVYKSEPYNNDWDGMANAGIKLLGKKLPEGSYFYSIQLEPTVPPTTGYVVLKR